MRPSIRSRLIALMRGQWAGLLALFLVVAGGTAYARLDITTSPSPPTHTHPSPLSFHPPPPNTIGSSDIINGQVKTPDLADNAVRSGKVLNENLTGADINESTLGQVPSATLGGLGRYRSSGSCDPETEAFVPCSVTSVTLPAPARLLVIGTVRARPEPNVDRAFGACRIGTTSGSVAGSEVDVNVDEYNSVAFDDELASVVAVTNPLPAGTHSVGIDCLQYVPNGAITYEQARVVAVALSAG